MASNAFLPPFIVEELSNNGKIWTPDYWEDIQLSNSLITISIKINANQQKASLQESYGNAFLYH